MRPRSTTPLLLALAVFGALLVAGCGGEHSEGEAVEGEPLELGPLLYNVQITRFLNPNDREDREYLVGAPPIERGEQYLAVFMRIENESDSPQRVPTGFRIEDVRGNIFAPLEIDNPFALDLGSVIAPHEEVPAPDTAAASGPIKGSMALFAVDETLTENRPFVLEIPGVGGEGAVDLDL